MIALRNAAHEDLHAQENSNTLELNDDSTATWVMMFYVADAALAVILIAAATVTYRSYKKELAEAEAE